jgi:hypothetical protein
MTKNKKYIESRVGTFNHHYSKDFKLIAGDGRLGKIYAISTSKGNLVSSFMKVNELDCFIDGLFAAKNY